jgi:hypothetical protein
MLCRSPSIMDSVLRKLGRCLLLLAAPLLWMPAARAQAPPAIIGRVSGADVSVESSHGASTTSNAQDFSVLSGDIVTVHSDSARLTLTAGGEAGICGPAKLTILESGDAITLALQFGRARVKLGGTTALTLYTPLFVATPVAITEGPRDMTLGLDASGRVCVLATAGGVRVEEQFTGESIIVPQPREIFLAGGELTPVSGAAGSCSCEVAVAQDVPRPASLPVPETAPAGIDEAAVPATAAAKKQQGRANTPRQNAGTQWEFSVPAGANEVHPAAPATAKAEVSAPPAPENPEWTVVMPALTFDALAPAPPLGPSPETILLIRDVQVRPDWVFTGRVLPKAARAKKTKTPPAPAAAAVGSPPAMPQKSFWSRVRGWFSGKSQTTMR